MIRKVISGAMLIALSSFLSTVASAQVPKEQLAKPPATAIHYLIQSTGGKHGDSYRWTTADGTHMARESLLLRGQVFEQDSATKDGKDGMPSSVVIRGYTPTGDAGETFTIAAGKVAQAVVDGFRAADVDHQGAVWAFRVRSRCGSSTNPCHPRHLLVRFAGAVSPATGSVAACAKLTASGSAAKAVVGTAT